MSRLRFLGTGTSYGVPRLGCRCAVCRSSDPRNRRRRSSVLIEDGGRRVLVDTTPDLRAQLLEIEVDRLDGVLITHVHADHVFGLDDLRGLTDEMTEPLGVFADAASCAELERVFSYVFARRPRIAGLPHLALHTVTPHVPVNVGGVMLTPLAAPHGRGTTLGFRAGGLAYFTDVSALPNEVLGALRGVDTLVLDLLQPGPHPTHLDRDTSVAYAEAIGARATWFIHMGHEIDHGPIDAGLPIGMRLAYDGLEIEVR